MQSFKFLGGNWFSRTREQWAPTHTALDPSPPLPLENPAATGVTGTVSATLGNVTASSVGAVGASGSVVATLGNVTSSSVGAVGASGSVAATLGNVTCAATGSTVTGTVVATLGNVTPSIAGAVGASGSVARVLGDVTCAAAGAVGASGSVARTLGDVTCAAMGTVSGGAGVTGTVAATLGDVTCAATGSTVSGSVAATLGNVTSSSVGAVGASGSVAATLGNVTSSVTGSVGASGSVASTLGNVTCAATGSAVSGSVAATLGNVTSSVTGSVGASGSVAATLGNVACAASGLVTVTGAVSRTLGDVTCSAAGAVGASGSVARTLGNVTCVAAGYVFIPVTGTVSATLGNVTCAATGSIFVNVEGAVAATLGDVTCVAVGVLASLPFTMLGSPTQRIVRRAGNRLNAVIQSETFAVASSGAEALANLGGSRARTSAGYLIPVTGSVDRVLGDVTCVATGTSSLPSTLLSQLVGGWKMDGDGTDVLGVSNGTLQGSGTSWGTGKLGSALYAGGAGRLNVGGAAQIKPTAAMTFGGWFWFNSAGDAGGRWCSDWHQDGDKDRWIFPYAPGAGQLYSHFNSNVYVGQIGLEILVSTWVHLAVTVALGSTVTTYRNGVPISTGTDGSLARTGPGNVCFGKQEEVGGGIDGRMDDLYMWSRRLSDAEMLTWFNSGAGRTHPFL